MTAIHTQGFSKRYGSTLALDSLDLSIEQGEVYGYLGPIEDEGVVREHDTLTWRLALKDAEAP